MIKQFFLTLWNAHKTRKQLEEFREAMLYFVVVHGKAERDNRHAPIPASKHRLLLLAYRDIVTRIENILKV